MTFHIVYFLVLSFTALPFIFIQFRNLFIRIFVHTLFLMGQFSFRNLRWSKEVQFVSRVSEASSARSGERKGQLQIRKCESRKDAIRYWKGLLKIRWEKKNF